MSVSKAHWSAEAVHPQMEQEGQEFRMIGDAQSAAALRDALERRGAREGHLGLTLDRRLDAVLQCMPAEAMR